MPYIILFSTAVLLHEPQKFIKNSVFFIAIIIFVNNILTNYYAAKVWMLGNRAEDGFSARFLSRLEEKEGFNPAKHKYTFIQSGTINFRPRYYTSTDNSPTDTYTLTAPYIPWHLPYKAYTFYYPHVFINQDFDVYWRTVNPAYIEMTPKLANYLTQTSAAWPKQNSIYFSPNLIILTQSTAGKKMGAHWYYNFFSGYPH